jgi:hypothetical protein
MALSDYAQHLMAEQMKYVQNEIADRLALGAAYSGTSSRAVHQEYGKSLFMPPVHPVDDDYLLAAIV